MPMNFKDAPPNTSGPPENITIDLVSTHIRLLTAAALRTTGDILELGCGWYSTPLLHEIARAQDRRLWTFDNQLYWLPPFKPFEKYSKHHLIKVGWWGEMYSNFPTSQHFGLAFIDQGQPIEREYSIRTFLENNMVDVYVMHDTEEGHAYGYDRTLPMFRWQWTDRSQKAWTTVASNVVDVTKWGLIELNSYDPSEGIT